MGTQRYIDTSFWDDAWIQELDPSQKFVYMYLLTNPLTNVAGISELTIKRICFDTGYNAETVSVILNRFQQDDKVYRWGNYIILKNAPKHQTLVKSKGDDSESKVTNIYKGIVSILNQLPDELLVYLYQIGYAFDLIPILEDRCIEYTEVDVECESVQKGSEGFQEISKGSNYSDLNSDLNSNSNLNIYTALKKNNKRFVKPSVQEISEYCKSRNNTVNPQRFFDYYESKGWKIGKSPMKNWKAAVRTWENNNFQTNNNTNNQKPITLENKISLGDYFDVQ